VLAYVTERFIQQICTKFETQQMDVLQSHSLIGMLAKDWRREIQWRPILQLAIERLLSRFGTVSEIEKVAHKLLKQPSQKLGYLASNLRDILVQVPEMY
jgi:hypothetical protein